MITSLLHPPFYKLNVRDMKKLLCKIGSHRLTQDVDCDNGGVDIFCEDCGKMFMPSDNYEPGDIPPNLSFWNNLLNRE